MIPTPDAFMMNSKRNARSALAVYCVNARPNDRRVFLQMNPKIRTAKMI
jgi:hypothetical protein